MTTALAIGYVRVSSDEQARDGVSLDAQTARLQAYATMMGLELVEVVREEAVSGSVPLKDRPAGARLAELGRRSEVRHVLTVKVDRLFRDASDCLQQTKRWDAAGIALHVLDLGGAALNTASAVGRMFLTMAAAFAEMERRLIGERTAAGLAFLRSQRRVYNHAPLGYRREGGRLEVDQAEMAVVERIQREAAGGASLHAIARGLRQDHVPTKTTGAVWAPNTVRKVLRNPIYSATTTK